jgi:hypothetical protein
VLFLVIGSEVSVEVGVRVSEMEIWRGKSICGESSIDCWEGIDFDPELFNNDSNPVSGIETRDEEEREKDEDRR